MFCKILSENEISEVNKDTTSLWDRYLSDFIQYKLLVSTEVFSVKNDENYLLNVLEDYFSPLKHEANVLHRIIALHIHIKLNHLHLARIISILHSVNQFLGLEDSRRFIKPMAQLGGTISYRQKDLAVYIANDMFMALNSAVESKESFIVWYKGYFNMVSFSL